MEKEKTIENMPESNYVKCAIEAMLFMSPRHLSLKDVYQALGDVDKKLVDLEVAELINEYNRKTSAIKVVQEGNRLEMVVKPEYIKFNFFATGKKLSKGELKTLATISLNEPVAQSELLKKRPFEHLPVLKELNLISVSKKGKKNILSTTEKFKMLFDKKKKQK